MCSGFEASLFLRLIDFVYHSSLGVRVIKKKKEASKSELPIHVKSELPEGLGNVWTQNGRRASSKTAQVMNSRNRSRVRVIVNPQKFIPFSAWEARQKRTTRPGGFRELRVSGTYGRRMGGTPPRYEQGKQIPISEIIANPQKLIQYGGSLAWNHAKSEVPGREIFGNGRVSGTYERRRGGAPPRRPHRL